MGQFKDKIAIKTSKYYVNILQNMWYNQKKFIKFALTIKIIYNRGFSNCQTNTLTSYEKTTQYKKWI